MTLPETPDGPRRGSGLGGRGGIKGAPSSVALGHETVAAAPRRLRAKAATSGDPQQRAGEGGAAFVYFAAEAAPPAPPPAPRRPCTARVFHPAWLGSAAVRGPS